jgi:integrase
MRLTKPVLTRITLPPHKSELIVFDDALPCFGVRLRAGGKRVYVAQYRVGTKQRRITIGSCDVLNLDEARRRARETLARVRLGADPQADRNAALTRASVTLGTVTERYLVAAERRLRPRSYEEVQRHLRKLWQPLSELPIDNVTRALVAARLGEIATTSGPVASNRARTSLSALFAWAMGEGLAESNPVIGTNKAADEVSRDRVLTDAELAAVWRACRDDDYGRIVRLLILTAQRREEVGALTLAELDLLGALWIIPADRAKNRRAHEVPLSRSALALLVPLWLGREDIMGFGAGADRFSGWSRAKEALDRRIAQSGFTMAPWRLHDLRRTAATRMADLGVLPHVIEAVLTHVSGHRAGIAGIYNRASYRADKREALDRWAKHIEFVVMGGRS